MLKTSMVDDVSGKNPLFVMIFWISEPYDAPVREFESTAASCLQTKPHSLMKLRAAWLVPGMVPLDPSEYTFHRYRSVGNDPFRMVVGVGAMDDPPVVIDSDPKAITEPEGEIGR